MINDAEKAKNIVLNYFAGNGRLIFNSEISLIKKLDRMWRIDIKSPIFSGSVYCHSESEKIIEIPLWK